MKATINPTRAILLVLLIALLIVPSASAIIKKPSKGFNLYFGALVPYNSISGDFKNQLQISIPALGETVFLPDMDNGFGVGAVGGIQKGRFAFELSLTRTTHSGLISASSTDAVLTTFSIDSKYHFFNVALAQPFLMAGVCIPRLKIEKAAESGGSVGDATFKGVGFNIGGGLTMNLGPTFAVSGNAAYRWVDYSKVTSLSGSDIEISGGITGSGITANIGVLYKIPLGL
jgi:outer membrane protein with beta-barrel domain